MAPSRTALVQFCRYVVVGLGSNAILYLAYLGLTYAGLGPKTSMTLLYVLGTVQSFMFNKHWSFESARSHGPEFVRYVLAYGFGYLLNLVALYALVDRAGYPHQAVQAVMICVLAALLFTLQKFWVFSPNLHSSRPAP
jgi:putative flippase GtrA